MLHSCALIAAPARSRALLAVFRGAFALTLGRVMLATVKVTLALVKGKHPHDKRETIRRRDVDRETRAAVKERHR